MAIKVLISNNSEWENKVGYSRAVKIGNIIEISGTVAVDNGMVIGNNDPYTQTKFILEKITTALKQLDSSIDDVIRTRIYVTNINHWDKIGKAHNEIFHNIRPACTMVEIAKLIHPDLLVEIEVSAIIK